MSVINPSVSFVPMVIALSVLISVTLSLTLDLADDVLWGSQVKINICHLSYKANLWSWITNIDPMSDHGLQCTLHCC